jgi:hypothetical protein
MFEEMVGWAVDEGADMIIGEPCQSRTGRPMPSRRSST